MTQSARTLAAAIALASGIPAFAQEPVGPARVRAQIAEQKLVGEVTAALATVDRLGRVDPAAATRALKTAAAGVRAALEVAPERRAEQLARLQARYALLYRAQPAGTATERAAVSAEAPPGRLMSNQKAAADTTAEAREVVEALRDIKSLNEASRFADAQARVASIARKYPNSPAVIALDGRGLFAERVASAQELARDQAERNSLALAEVDRSARPAKRDVEYAADFKERMALRDKLAGFPLDPEVEAILKALETPVPATLTGGPFREVVQGISNLIGKKLIVDDRAFADEGRDAGKAIEVPTGVSARTALRVATRSQGMTFIIKENYIHVVTLEEARRSCVKRSYYIGDVLGGPLSGGATNGPAYDASLSGQVAQLIVENIRRSIDPSVWDGQGGVATVSYHAPSMNLIVSAPAEVQADVYKSVAPRR